jgi:NAD(P)-dependent dehydrogenase (short-subunit alcohol dehydrogenase family)
VRVQNKVIAVTGGGNGIGRELVLNLVGRGAKVAAIDIQQDALSKTMQLAGDKRENVSTYVVDITERDRVEALPDEIITQHGAIDGVINNAGIIQPLVRLHDLEYDVIERVLSVNLLGTIYVTRTFLPHLLKRPQAHIVNVSSMGGFLPVPGQTLYCASKAAVKLLTEGLNAELLGTNVRVTVVFPGAIETDIVVNSEAADGFPMDRSLYKMIAPSDAARTIVNGMERDRYRVLIGSDAKMTDLLYRLSPKQATKLIYSQMSFVLPD